MGTRTWGLLTRGAHDIFGRTVDFTIMSRHDPAMRLTRTSVVRGTLGLLRRFNGHTLLDLTRGMTYLVRTVDFTIIAVTIRLWAPTLHGAPCSPHQLVQGVP
jgi:hypothetical protein